MALKPNEVKLQDVILLSHDLQVKLAAVAAGVEVWAMITRAHRCHDRRKWSNQGLQCRGL